VAAFCRPRRWKRRKPMTSLIIPNTDFGWGGDEVGRQDHLRPSAQTTACVLLAWQSSCAAERRISALSGLVRSLCRAADGRLWVAPAVGHVGLSWRHRRLVSLHKPASRLRLPVRLGFQLNTSSIELCLQCLATSTFGRLRLEGAIVGVGCHRLHRQRR
jgi:hypothetical protein